MRRIAFAVMLLITGSTTALLQAQEQTVAFAERGPRFLLEGRGPTPVALDVSKTPVLRQRISVNLEGVTLEQALTDISAQAGLQLMYSKDLVPLARTVRLKAEDITVAAALTDVLLDANVDVLFSRTGQVALVKRRPAAAVRQAGSIHGRVTDATTGEPIGAATVTLEGTKLGATTGDSGQYQIVNVPAGTYMVSARRLGYAPVRRPVTVVGDSVITIDFALQQSANQLDQVIVTGTVIPTKVKALPNPVSIMTADDITRQPVRRLDELFRQVVPGSLAPDWAAEPQGSTMSVRGASDLTGGTGLKVYIDGIEMSSQTSAVLDPNSIERVEVIRGPEATAIYGSGAIGGVMQIFTKHGRPGLVRPQFEMQAMLGTVQSQYKGSGAVRQAYSGTIRGGSKTAGYALGGGYTSDGPWVPGYYMSTPSVFGGAHLEQGPLTLDVSGRYYAHTYDLAYEPALFQSGVAIYSKPFYEEAQGREETYGAHLVYTAKPWWHQNLTIGIDRYVQHLHTTRPRLTTPADTLFTVTDIDDPKTSVAYNTSVVIPLGRATSATVTAGVDHYDLARKSFATSGAVNTRGAIVTDPALPPAVNYSVTTNTGYFAQAQVAFHDELFFTGALRGEQNSDFGGELGTVWSPRGGVSYVRPLGPVTLKMRASYGEAIQPPSPAQQAANVTSVNVQLANPLLRPERQVGGDGGIDLVIGATGSLGVTYYDQTARDLIQSVRFTADTAQFQNVGEIRNRGWEIEGKLNVGPAQIRAQYAFTRSTVEALGALYTGDLRVGQQVMRVPRHTGGGSIALAPWKGTEVTMGLAYVGAQDYYDVLAYYRCFGKTGPCRGSTLSAYRITYPAFAKANLSVTQRITPNVAGLLMVENLTNKNAYEMSSTIFPTQGRITTAGLKVNF